MKLLPLVLGCLSLCTAVCAQTPMNTSPKPATPSASLPSDLHDWEKLIAKPNAKGFRRDVFDGPTTTLDKMHCHITTLNPGEKSGEPSKHLQEEVIIVKEGLVEAQYDGKSKIGGPGSVIFFAAGATTALRNAGPTQCTYIVVYYYTPLTPKG